MSNKNANRLIHEQSPYLLQHAYNPVDWYPWGEEAWEKARNENRLVIVSIGYSACHWCHVMEHQSFENPEVAALMNQYFISIKVDREERPDIDAVYMEAVQLMTGRGGWPLNCITLPDGRPVYGGTYFPKENWMETLDRLQEIFVTDPAKMEEYAQRLHQGLADSELIKTKPEGEPPMPDHRAIIEKFTRGFDPVYGGPNKAPKFPMPCNYEFLLNYGVLHQNEPVQEHVRLTLSRMAWGGIFDQLAGGFARYSVDEKWKVPHFEKMLYDNGQLLGLYAKAYAFYKEPLFRETAEKIVAFLQNELLAPEGIYYSALDADSDGEEGKFYVWKKEELAHLLDAADLRFAEAYYSINDFGYWEHDNYVLIREKDDDAVCADLGMSPKAFLETKQRVEEKLLSERSKRVRPGLDDKALLAWNAIVLKGLAEAAVYLNNPHHYEAAVALHHAIQKCFCDNNGAWFRSYKNGQRAITAFSEDLALLADAQLALYEAGFDAGHLFETTRLLAVLDREFFDAETGLYFFTAHQAQELIVRRTEVFDNVIPSPNSVLAGVLYKAGVLTGQDVLTQRALDMVSHMARYFENAPQALAGWLNVWLMTQEQKEMVVAGPDYLAAAQSLRSMYIPLAVWCAADTEDGWPLLAQRLVEGQTTMYECRMKTCSLPVKYLAD